MRLCLRSPMRVLDFGVIYLTLLCHYRRTMILCIPSFVCLLNSYSAWQLPTCSLCLLQMLLYCAHMPIYHYKYIPSSSLASSSPLIIIIVHYFMTESLSDGFATVTQLRTFIDCRFEVQVVCCSILVEARSCSCGQYCQNTTFKKSEWASTIPDRVPDLPLLCIVVATE